MRVVPSEGSGRYSPGPGMVKLLEEMVLPGITTFDGDLFTQSARYPCYSLRSKQIIVRDLVSYFFKRLPFSLETLVLEGFFEEFLVVALEMLLNSTALA